MIVNIAVATHKKINFSLPDIYIPVQVNAKQNGEWKNYVHDSDGVNISQKNPSYCELTAMYWLWKNSNADIKGLCHYRRFFSNNTNLTMSQVDIRAEEKIKDCVLQEKEIVHILERYDVIVVRPYLPYPLNEKNELKHWCYEKDIEQMRKTISAACPDYLETYDQVMQSTNLSHYNMIIAKSKTFNNYAQWLFSILNEYEKDTNIQDYDVQHKRLYGYIAEVLLNVFILRNNMNVKYAKVVMPARYINVNRKNLFKFTIKEKIEQLFISIKSYWLIERIYKNIRREKYDKYIACRKAMGLEDK